MANREKRREKATTANEAERENPDPVVKGAGAGAMSPFTAAKSTATTKQINIADFEAMVLEIAEVELKMRVLNELRVY